MAEPPIIDTDAVSIAMTKVGIRPEDAAKVLDILEGCDHNRADIAAWDPGDGCGTLQCETCGEVAHFSLEYRTQEWHGAEVCEAG